MKKRDRYLRIVEWSDEDRCYVGRVPGLALGGIHGRNPEKVFAELGQVIDELIEVYEREGRPLPASTAGKTYSGKFNLRIGPELHERLAIESFKTKESLNSYCRRVLEEDLQRGKK